MSSLPTKLAGNAGWSMWPSCSSSTSTLAWPSWLSSRPCESRLIVSVAVVELPSAVGERIGEDVRAARGRRACIGVVAVLLDDQVAELSGDL